MLIGTGTGISDDDLSAMISQGDRIIDARLSLLGVSGDESSGALKSASLMLAQSIVINRLVISGGIGKLKVGDLQIDNDPTAAISSLEARAFRMIDQYAETSAGSQAVDHYVVKVN